MIDIPEHSKHRFATLFLRLEGPVQSWGGRSLGRFRRTETAPTKSGVIGMLGAALGLHRRAMNQRLDALNRLTMAVRVDRAGHHAEDYQTVGAKIGVLAADGQIKKTAGTGEFEAIISPREYLIDASFLVVLHGNQELIEKLGAAVRNPEWPLFLGRKRCVPATSIFAGVCHEVTIAEAVQCDGPDDQSLLVPDNSESARVITDLMTKEVFASLMQQEAHAIDDQYEMAKSYMTDRLVRLDPPVHAGRIVLDFKIARPESTVDRPMLQSLWFGLPGPYRPDRASDPEAKKVARFKSAGRCIFCQFEPPDPRKLHAHHLTYARRGRERVDVDSDDIGHDDLVMLCDECHAAVTMLEYQNGFGLVRIDPREPRWHARIVAAREARRRHRSAAHPIIIPGPRPHADKEGKRLDLIESVIPLRAGSSFAPESPGNRWLANRHHVHQRLSMAFPDAGGRFAASGYGVTRDEGGFLYRIEPGSVANIVVRSRVLPDWGRAFARATWLVREKIPAPRRFDLCACQDETEWSFDLEANPVKRLREDGPQGRKGMRVPLRDDGALEKWIARRAGDAGFEIIDGSLNVRIMVRQTARMKRCPDRHWDAAHFSGQLRVIDAGKFRDALVAGIGPAKAFGFGLLSIAPAPIR